MSGAAGFEPLEVAAPEWLSVAKPQARNVFLRFKSQSHRFAPSDYARSKRYLLAI
jgi:hypothetical protein